MKLLDRRDAGPVARTISPRNGGIVNCTRQHAVVTGASSGIGRATALRLVAARHHVYAGVRNPADGDELRRSARSGARSGRDGTDSDATRGELTPVMLDVTNAGHIAEAAAMVTEHTADLGLAGLVNNAGIGLACPTELLPLDTFRQQVEINVTGQLAVTQAFLPSLRRAQGRIVIISTIGVRFRPPFAGALDATKAALATLADAFRQEHAPWGVRVVLVEPASINSPAADKVARDAATAMAGFTPAGRALYEKAFTRMLEVMVRREKAGSTPEIAAETITRALTVRRPRAVYLTGKNARRLALISRLPTPLFDAARRRVFGLPAPGSLTDVGAGHARVVELPGRLDGAASPAGSDRTVAPAGR